MRMRGGSDPAARRLLRATSGRPGRVLGAATLVAVLGVLPSPVPGAPSAAVLPPVVTGAAEGEGAARPVRSWEIESFRAEIVVRADAVVEVTETIRPRFTGSYEGIYRRIPVEYWTPAGFSHDLRLEVLSVTDGRGGELRHEVTREADYRQVKVWIPGAEDAVRTVVIRYRSPNALKFFEDYHELYWNVTGTEWPVPIHRASAQVLLPEEVTGVRVRGYAGPEGSRQQNAEVTVEGRRITVRSPGSLGYGEGLTAAVAWDPGVTREPGTLQRASYFLQDNWPLGLPLLVAALMFAVWYRRGRDSAIGSVAPRYEPPEELTPAGAGVLIDTTPDMRDITATIVDLAIQGYLQIAEEEEEKFFGLASDRDYVFELLRDRADWSGLNPHERHLLGALFEGGLQQVRLSDLEDEFYKDLPDLRDRMMDLLVGHGFFDRRPDKVKRFWIGVAVAVAVGSCFVAGFLGWRLGASPLVLLLSGFLTAGVITAFGWLMPIRTRKGTQALTELLGFEEFLDRVESDRFRKMITGPEMFEEFLPYAMALGVEKKWAAAFDDLVTEPPEWYSGRHVGGFRPKALATDLGRLNTRAASALTSSPRSSGGSGFSGGGGSVGGGVGGGGGGAF